MLNPAFWCIYSENMLPNGSYLVYQTYSHDPVQPGSSVATGCCRPITWHCQSL